MENSAAGFPSKTTCPKNLIVCQDFQPFRHFFFRVYEVLKKLWTSSPAIKSFPSCWSVVLGQCIRFFEVRTTWFLHFPSFYSNYCCLLNLTTSFLLLLFSLSLLLCSQPVALHSFQYMLPMFCIETCYCPRNLWRLVLNQDQNYWYPLPLPIIVLYFIQGILTVVLRPVLGVFEIEYLVCHFPSTIIRISAVCLTQPLASNHELVWHSNKRFQLI